ncbi:MAG: NAD(P)-binding domain-containing protein [Selenomonadaceae bacterium]|nr:NAD(P)-binding domain-containing protein [Selenomonadaceae bacterium]
MADDFVRGIIGDGFGTEILLTALGKQVGVNPSEMYVACRSQKRCIQLREQYNARAVVDAMEFLPDVKILILALQVDDDADKMLDGLNKKIPADALIISCTYGMKIKTVEKYFPAHPVIRLIMNPMIVTGAGVCAYAVGSVDSTDSENIAQFLLNSIGETIKTSSEAELETVGDLALASTIFSFMTANTFIELGAKKGLSVDKSWEIVSQVIGGVTKTLIHSDAVIDNLIQESKRQKKLFEHGKEILEKVGFIDAMKKRFASAEVTEVVKFRYNYWR